MREIKCKICGKSFYTDHPQQKCCSEKCAQLNRLLNRRARREKQKAQAVTAEKAKRKSYLDEKIRQAESIGKRYADLQKEETLRILREKEDALMRLKEKRK